MKPSGSTNISALFWLALCLVVTSVHLQTACKNGTGIQCGLCIEVKASGQQLSDGSLTVVGTCVACSAGTLNSKNIVCNTGLSSSAGAVCLDFTSQCTPPATKLGNTTLVSLLMSVICG